MNIHPPYGVTPACGFYAYAPAFSATDTFAGSTGTGSTK